MVHPFQRPVILLTSSDGVEATLRQSLHPPFMLTRVQNWAELRDTLSDATPSALCLLDGMIGDDGDRGLSESLREATREFPHIPFVACLEIDPTRCSESLVALQDWGISEVLDFRRERSVGAIKRRLASVKNAWAHRIFESVLPPALSTRGTVLLSAAAGVAAEGGHVPELAERLGIDERTVPRWCAAAGVPNARRLLAWIRLLFAADLLDRSSHSFEFIARHAGYASAASLKSTTKQFTRLTPTELRLRGAFLIVADLFRAELREARDELQGRQRRNAWFN